MTDPRRLVPCLAALGLAAAVVCGPASAQVGGNAPNSPNYLTGTVTLGPGTVITGSSYSFAGAYTMNGSFLGQTSGSAQNTTGTISAASPSLAVAAAVDFRAGQGILVSHAGGAYSSGSPSVFSVTPQGATGATTYNYQLSGCDRSGGLGTAIAAVQITNGNATLTGTNFNRLAWTNASNYCTAIWRKIGAGAYAFVTVVGNSQTTYDDSGLNDTAPFWVPSTPNGAALPDFLVTTINAVSGTTLTLAANASSAVTTGYVQHDDTVALQAAVTAAYANAQATTPGPTGNLAASWTWPAVELPDGSRNLISSTITLPSAVALVASGSATVEIAGYNNGFSATDSRRVLVRNLAVIGGARQFSLSNANINDSLYRFENVSFLSSADFAIFTAGDYSTILECTSCRAFNVNGFVSSDTDMIDLDKGWWQSGYTSWQADRAWVVQSHGTTYYNQMTRARDITAVPIQLLGYGASGTYRQGSRWFDVNGQLVSNGNRWGGEDAGIPIVKVTSTLSAATTPQIYQGAQIDILDGWAYAGPTSGMAPTGVVVLGGIPASVHLAGNMGPSPSPLIQEAAGFTFSTVLATWKAAASITDATPYINFFIDEAGGRFTAVTKYPTSVTPYVTPFSQGTWTPALKGSTGGGTPTHSAQNGYWTRKGREVWASFYIVTSALNAPTGEMQIDMSTLPFPTNASGTNQRGYCEISDQNGVTLDTSYTQLSALIESAGAVIRPWEYKSAGGAGAATPVSDYAAATRLSGACTFQLP